VFAIFAAPMIAEICRDRWREGVAGRPPGGIDGLA
jgi:hypothetical protein